MSAPSEAGQAGATALTAPAWLHSLYAGRWAARLQLAILGLQFLLLFFVMPHAIVGDASTRFAAINDLLAGRPMPPNPWPLIGSVISIPFYLLGHVVETPDWWVGRYNVVVLAAGVVYLYRVMRPHMEPALVRGFLLLLSFTAMLPHDVASYGSETFNVVLVGAGLVAWRAGHWKEATLIMAVGAANAPGTLPGMALALAWWGWRHKRLRAALPALLGALIYGAENWLERGSALVTGYEHLVPPKTIMPYSGMNGFTYPLFFGVSSLLFAFGKGILWFCSGMFLPFRRGWEALGWGREVMVLWLVMTAGLLVTYGKFFAWYGGHAWGPRYLVFASLPASLLLAGQLLRPPRSTLARLAVLASLALSFWVGVSGETFNMYGQNICLVDNYLYAPFCWYVPEFSVLWQPFVSPPAHIRIRFWLLILFAALTCLYLGLPLLLRWAAGLRRQVGELWEAHGRRPAWRF